MSPAVATPPEPGPCGKVVAVETAASGQGPAIPSPATPTKLSQSCAAVILGYPFIHRNRTVAKLIPGVPTLTVGRRLRSGVRRLREKHPGPLQVIWDNAPAHRGRRCGNTSGRPG